MMSLCHIKLCNGSTPPFCPLQHHAGRSYKLGDPVASDLVQERRLVPRKHRFVINARALWVQNIHHTLNIHGAINTRLPSQPIPASRPNPYQPTVSTHTHPAVRNAAYWRFTVTDEQNGGHFVLGLLSRECCGINILWLSKPSTIMSSWQSDGMYSIGKVLVMSGLNMRSRAMETAKEKERRLGSDVVALDAFTSDVESEPRMNIITTGTPRCGE